MMMFGAGFLVGAFVSPLAIIVGLAYLGHKAVSRGR